MTYSEAEMCEALSDFSVTWLPNQGVFVQRGEIKPRGHIRPPPCTAEALKEAHEAIETELRNDRPKMTRMMVVNLFFRFTKEPRHLVVSGRRSKPLVRARFQLAWILKQLTDSSYPEISRIVGRKDHSTVIYAVARVEADTELKFEAEAMMERILRAAS